MTADPGDWYHAERLHRAAADCDRDLASALIAEGVPLSTFDDIGYTPLHFAVRHGHFAIAQLLIDAGADVNARQEETNSNTAIAEAARSSSAEMVQFLLERGADPAIPGWMGIDAYVAADLRKDEHAPRIRNILRSHSR